MIVTRSVIGCGAKTSLLIGCYFQICQHRPCDTYQAQWLNHVSLKKQAKGVIIRCIAQLENTEIYQTNKCPRRKSSSTHHWYFQSHSSLLCLTSIQSSYLDLVGMGFDFYDFIGLHVLEAQVWRLKHQVDMSNDKICLCFSRCQ